MNLQPPRNQIKVRKAFTDPNRPGEDCKAPPGQYYPVVDFGSCEGKKDCAEVCPYSVFEIKKIHKEDFDKLSFFQKIKNRVHGGIVAYTPQADLCQACGLCVVACPEKAITLSQVPPRNAT